MTNIEHFKSLDIRVGTIVRAEFFKEARDPAYKLQIDFGDEIGIKNSSAQITDRYDISDLLGKQIIAIINFPPLRIAGYKSEVLVIGGVLSDKEVVLLNIDEAVPNGTKIS
ncbi:tRNA-binding protein [Marinilactibacillus psychrotolerans]|uniref:Chaperone CsaA n=2 Tax=Marinilactibacillus psychrotolerans TaxID=191770 RepID=A0A511GYD6_9LACT|nr:tRNA-binding protein [Marinilactibacillus psychrotolerans]TLQ08663.1 tRNA-binding protein [Marinilactibacillus psychrotolerans]SDC23947.1 tRNA-binding protein [Marinilactibacillus psychrotolerans]SJN42092.1 Protein secretion chaperonin CsaA [Marinilactibacillus psychrotolerans 42ea]GEL66281.1 putative chaperone CsaA [Marinilactibacillus psychrotolerans]GEQ32593.1 putative chaperone CsaA [Marinilactibacillus psychrotolerans]